jgi:WD40 repeat protein
MNHMPAIFYSSVNSSDALISRTTKHSGAIKTLQFNPKHPNLLATGGAKGEVGYDPSITGWICG